MIDTTWKNLSGLGEGTAVAVESGTGRRCARPRDERAVSGFSNWGRQADRGQGHGPRQRQCRPSRQQRRAGVVTVHELAQQAGVAVSRLVIGGSPLVRSRVADRHPRQPRQRVGRHRRHHLSAQKQSPHRQQSQRQGRPAPGGQGSNHCPFEPPVWRRDKSIVGGGRGAVLATGRGGARNTAAPSCHSGYSGPALG
jgi:hypothetical protein